MSIASNITTAEQLLKAGDIGRCELVRGELIMMSPAGHDHGRIAMRLGRFLDAHVDQHGLGAVYAAETGFLIGRDPDSVRAPDVAFVGSERVRTVRSRGFFPGAPDLAVEVLSPRDTASEVLDKVNGWIAAETAEVWVVDPERKTLTIYRKDQPVHVLHERDELTCESLLPGFRIQVADIFR